MNLNFVIASALQEIAERISDGWPMPHTIDVRANGDLQLSFHRCVEPLDDWTRLFGSDTEPESRLLHVDSRRVEYTRWTGNWQGHPVEIGRYVDLSPVAPGSLGGAA